MTVSAIRVPAILTICLLVSVGCSRSENAEVEAARAEAEAAKAELARLKAGQPRNDENDAHFHVGNNLIGLWRFDSVVDKQFELPNADGSARNFEGNTLQFKPGGLWEVVSSDGLHIPSGSGTWKLDRSLADGMILHCATNSDLTRIQGWTVTFETEDRIRISADFFIWGKIVWKREK